VTVMSIPEAASSRYAPAVYADIIQRAAASRRDLRDYALAQFGKTFFWIAADTLTIFLLVRRDGYAPAAAGWVFLAGLSWNAVCDVMVGFWADRRSASDGTLVPVLRAAVPLMGVAFAASVLISSENWGWSVFATLLFRSAFALYDVPHNALMAQLSRTPELNLRIANLRPIASSVASLMVGALATQLLDPQAQEWALQLLMLLGFVAMVLMLPVLRCLPRQDDLSEDSVTGTAGTPGSPAETMSLVRLCIATAVGTIALATLDKGILHVDVAHHPWATSMLLLLMIGGIAAIVVVGPATALLGSVGTLRGAYVAATLLVLGLPLAVSSNGVVCLTLILLIGVAQGMQLISSWMILVRLVRSSPEQLRRRSSRFGIYTMTTKVARGASGLLLGLLLSGMSSADITRSVPADGVMDSATLWRLCVLVAVGTAMGALWSRQARRASG
jgi:glycoside/pentoside/hexuronide:cation symporter, GPH family